MAGLPMLALLAGTLVSGCGLVLGATQTPATAEKTDVPAEGATLFHERGCEYCHGAGGIGTERGPSLLGVGKKLRTNQISTQIHEGGGAMPAFGDVLTTPEIDALTAYLQTLKKPAAGSKPKAATAKKPVEEAR